MTSPSKRYPRRFRAAICAATLVTLSCSDDAVSPIVSNTADPDAVIEPGWYDVTLDVSGCEGGDVFYSTEWVDAACRKMAFGEINSFHRYVPYDCPVVVDAGVATMLCTVQVVGVICTDMIEVSGSGTYSEDGFTFDIEQRTLSSSPPGCFPQADCLVARVVATRREPAVPSACAQAQAHRFEGTITGGGAPGNVVLVMVSAIGIRDNGLEVRCQATSSTDDPYQSFTLQLPILDPDTLDLPITIPARTSTVVNYSQASFAYQEFVDGESFYGIPSSGSVTIHEFTAQHVSGTIDMIIAPGNTGKFPRTLHIQGGFFIVSDDSYPVGLR